MVLRPAPFSPQSPRMRIRDLLPTLHLGDFIPGPLNSLTDVPGVKVSTLEIYGLEDSSSSSNSSSSICSSSSSSSSTNSRDNDINTGVTSILPHADWAYSALYAGLCRFNGAGEVTGAQLIDETGLLCSPIILTGTFGIGAAHQEVYEYGIETLGGAGEEGRREKEKDKEREKKEKMKKKKKMDWLTLPVVAETFDGFLHDCASFAVRPNHVIAGLLRASGERVPEGNVGGGTGMVCHGFKGGNGSSSRIVSYDDVVIGDEKMEAPTTYTIAALVQANYGSMKDLRIGGVPVGRILAAEIASGDAHRKKQQDKLNHEKEHKDGSIIVILATDAPLYPLQLQRIAKRATVGLSRAGGQGHNLSGDIFLAFSTANKIPINRQGVRPPEARGTTNNVDVVDDSLINPLFGAAADVTEEAIYNALCMAETMVGNGGHRVEALPLDRVREIMREYSPL